MSKHLPKQTNLAKRLRVVALREKGLTLQEIATEVGTTRQAVHQVLQTHARKLDAGGKEAYK